MVDDDALLPDDGDDENAVEPDRRAGDGAAARRGRCETAATMLAASIVTRQATLAGPYRSQKRHRAARTLVRARARWPMSSPSRGGSCDVAGSDTPPGAIGRAASLVVGAGPGDDGCGDRHLPGRAPERGEPGGDPGLAEIGRRCPSRRRSTSGVTRSRRGRSPPRRRRARRLGDAARRPRGRASVHARAGGGPVPGRVIGAGRSGSLSPADSVEPDLRVAAAGRTANLAGSPRPSWERGSRARRSRCPAGPGRGCRAAPRCGRGSATALTVARPRRLRIRAVGRRQGSTRIGDPRSRAGRRTPPRPTVFTWASRSATTAPSSPRTSTSSAAYRSQGSGRGRCGPVDGRVLLGQGQPEVVSTAAPSPTRGDRPAGPRARCRTASSASGRPGPDRAGPASPRGGPTRCSMPSATGRGRGTPSGR